MQDHTYRSTDIAADAAEPVQTAPAAATAVKRPEDYGYWQTQFKRVKKYRRVLWFIIPAALFTLIFSYIPMLGVLFSFKGGDFNLLRGGVLENLFTGEWTFQNYLDIFVDISFLKGVLNTFIINIFKLLICFPLSIIVAVQLSELKSQTLSKIILIIICIPNFLSWAIVIGTWSGLLDSQGGVLNELLVMLNFIEPNYFTMSKDHLFKFFVILLAAWKGTGWGSIMFYAAIMAIDKSFYESATLEGANRLQKTWYLTIPAIMPTIALMLVLNISGFMAAGFEQIYTMMQVSEELEETQITLDTYIYTISIVNRTNIPFATALGVFNGLISLLLMLVGNAITTKTLHRSLW